MARFLVGFFLDVLPAADFAEDFFAERRFATSGPWDVVLVGAIKGSLWAEYTSQAGSVTDGIPGCRTGQSGLPDSDSRLGANRFSVRTKKASCSRWSSGRTGLAAASLTGKSLQNVCVAGVPLRPRPYMHGPIF